MKAQATLDCLRLNQTMKVGTILGEWDVARTRLHEVVSTHRQILKAREEMKGKVADMLRKDKKPFEEARVRVVTSHEAEVSKLLEKVDSLTDEVEAKGMEIQSLSGLVEEVVTL